jgi:hypothetical protein
VETHNLVLADAQARAREQIDQIRFALEAEKVAHAENKQRLDRELTLAYEESNRLEKLRREMEASRAWRLHRWMEKFRR